MQPLRAYLLIFSDSGCESSVHRDLENLCEAWKPYSGKDDITGVIHVGFGRPETEAFAVCANKFKGRMLLSASARWALGAVCECAPMIAGEAETIPLFVALNGWGYDASAEEMDLINPTEAYKISVFAEMKHTEPVGEQVQTLQIDSILSRSVDDLDLPPRPAHCLRAKGIFLIGELLQCTESDLHNLPNFGRKSLQEINWALSSLDLPRIKRGHAPVKQGAELQISPLTSSTIFTSENVDPITLIRFAPPWLLSVSLTDLGLQVRTFNALNSQGFTVVGDIADIASESLLNIPNFGRGSLNDLAHKLKLAIERGPALNASNQPLADIEENASSPALNKASIRLGSQFRNIDSLTSIVAAAISSLPPNIEKVVRARMGLDSEPMILQEVGDNMGVTRERVRQLEAKGVSRIGCDPVWEDGLEAKLAKLLDGRDDPLPFSGLPILDAWFCGIEKMREPFNYLLEHKDILNHHFSLLQANGQLFVSRLSQDEWNKAVKQAMQLLEVGVNHGWSLSEARRRVEDLLGLRGRELRSELWVAAKRFAHFSSSHTDGEPVLVSYGRSTEALVEAVLSESDRPLHYSEIPQRVAERYGKSIEVRRAHAASGKVALLYGKGFYGFLKHCPLNYQERELVREEVLEAISHGASDRQWSCAELMDILNERGLDFDDRLNAYTLNISLVGSSEINYLGRYLWTQSGTASSGASHRIDIRQAVTSLLMQAGKPMSTSEIKEALRKDRGISNSFQIFPSESIISVGTGLWGLIERDFPLDAVEQAQLIDVLQKMLQNRKAGIHISEIIPCLEGVFEPASRIKDPALIFAVAQRSGLMSKSTGGYLFLPEWGDPRRMHQSQAILEAMRQSGDHGLTANEILKRASVILGREIPRANLNGHLSSVARFNEETKRWLIASAVDELDDEPVDLKSHQRISQINNSARLNVARGAIFGALAGDAAGATLEFIGRKPESSEVDNAMCMVGGGVWKTAPGQVTDDGELTLALALALADQPHFLPNRVAQFYRRWRMSHPFDIGHATSAALSMGDVDASDLADIVFKNARTYNSESKANGSLMRATPLGVWASNIDPSEAINAARSDAKLTHPNPTCQWACVSYVMAIRHLMLYPGDAKGAFTAAEQSLSGEESGEVRKWLVDAQEGELPPYHPLAGFVRIGFTYAFYHLIKGSSYMEALHATLSGGGDTDTNACIVGGLVGAAKGVESISPRILNSITTCDTTKNGRHRPDWLSTKKVEQLIPKLIGQ